LFTKYTYDAQVPAARYSYEDLDGGGMVTRVRTVIRNAAAPLGRVLVRFRRSSVAADVGRQANGATVTAAKRLSQ
jgi:hypothetical protein